MRGNRYMRRFDLCEQDFGHQPAPWEYRIWINQNQADWSRETGKMAPFSDDDHDQFDLWLEQKYGGTK